MDTGSFINRCALLGATALTVTIANVAAALTQSNDTVVVRITPPRHPGVATLVSDLQYGAGTRAPEFTYTSVRNIVPRSDGSIVVLGVQQSQVRIFDSSGKFVRGISQIAGGRNAAAAPPPPRAIGVLPDGRILINGVPGNQTTVYDSLGFGSPFVTHVIFGTYVGPPDITVTAGGTVYLRHTRFDAGPAGRTPVPGYARAREGNKADTIYLPPFPVVGPPRLIARNDTATGLRGVENDVPYAPSLYNTVSPLGYLVSANTGRYAIDLLIPETWNALASPPPIWKPGDRVISLRRDSVVPVKVGDEERASRKASLERSMRAVDPKWTWTGPEIPSEKPILTAIAFGSDGRIWVHLSTPSEAIPNSPIMMMSLSFSGNGPPPAATVVGTETAWREPMILFDVLEPDGTYIGQVSVPTNISIYGRRGDYVWGTMRNADRTLTLHRFRINWSPGRDQR